MSRFCRQAEQYRAQQGSIDHDRQKGVIFKRARLTEPLTRLQPVLPFGSALLTEHYLPFDARDVDSYLSPATLLVSITHRWNSLRKLASWTARESIARWRVWRPRSWKKTTARTI